MDEEPLPSDAKRRLCALLVHQCASPMNVLVWRPKKRVSLFSRSFARRSVTERTLRMQRSQPGRILLLPSQATKRPREVDEEDKVNAVSPRLREVLKTYDNKRLYDGCIVCFRWCCAGSLREPCEDLL
jgi:hypothetical protein